MLKQKLDLYDLISDPMRTVIFESLSTCPLCHNKELEKLGRLPDRHDPCKCLDLAISCDLAKIGGLRVGKHADKILKIREWLNRKRVLHDPPLPPIIESM